MHRLRCSGIFGFCCCRGHTVVFHKHTLIFYKNNGRVQVNSLNGTSLTNVNGSLLVICYNFLAPFYLIMNLWYTLIIHIVFMKIPPDTTLTCIINWCKNSPHLSVYQHSIVFVKHYVPHQIKLFFSMKVKVKVIGKGIISAVCKQNMKHLSLMFRKF